VLLGRLDSNPIPIPALTEPASDAGSYEVFKKIQDEMPNEFPVDVHTKVSKISASDPPERSYCVATHV